jgi:RNA polymerase sigma-70 factor (ECF subfamily)
MSYRWPDTRHTLIARLKDPTDQASWEAFIAIYEPLILRYALRRGLQHADAADISQRVLWSVARAVDSWSVGGEYGSFRGWLAKVTRNAVINLLERDAKHWGTGDSLSIDRLFQIPDSLDDSMTIWNREHELQVFRLAATQVKSRFQDDSWTLFLRTTAGAESIETVASDLGKSLGAAYAIRSRIMAAIREAAKAIQAEETEGTTS